MVYTDLCPLFRLMWVVGLVLSLGDLPIHLADQLSHVTDMCDHGSVDSAAVISFTDNVQRYFISNGHHYWFLNVTSERPDVESALKIPYDFKPDVAILKDTRGCSNGHLSLLLLQMRKLSDTNEAEWLTLEMKIGRWNSNESVFWNNVKKIAHCDLEVNICTTTDSYFRTMSFDFKTKLDAAFGVIGGTAYFIQGEKLYRVNYKSQCIENPFKEVLTYPAVPIDSTLTAALTVADHQGNLTLTLFDRDAHLNFSIANLDNVLLNGELNQAERWHGNTNHFFHQCPLLESPFSFLFEDLFSGSKRHYHTKRIVLITCASAFVLLIVISSIAILARYLRSSMKQDKHKEAEVNGDANEEKLITNPGQNGEQQKTLLQTSC